ncbi:hypothetical protein HOLleu_38066 [Holothuria leucospilota]|uniref:Uncharacterized protein n=1 Tax=Holothuria leucospilota TaxID=206669 RepID=A0A9Q0YKF2_HOLLE|nr:hypothetical protein HOLleu_38066 [Holothuria leucospilota]
MTSEGDVDDHTTKGKHHEFQSFGYFLVKAAEEIDLDLVMKLATSFEFSPAETSKLECSTQSSLAFMRRMRQKGLIEPDNIKKLVDRLRRHGEDGTAKEIEKCFRTIGSGTTGICSGVSEIDVKDTFDDSVPLEHGSLGTSQEQSSANDTRKRKQEIVDETRKMRHIQDFVPGEDCMIYVLMKTSTLDESQMNKEVKVSLKENEDENKENIKDEAKFKEISSKHDHRDNTGRTGNWTEDEQHQVDGGKGESEEEQMKGEDDNDRESEENDEDENIKNKDCDDGDDDGDDGNDDDDEDVDGDDDHDDDDADSCSKDDDTYESTYLVVKNDLKLMQLHIRKRTESEIEVKQAFKIKDYSQCEDVIVIGESSVMRKLCNDRFFRGRVTPELIDKLLNTHLQMQSACKVQAFDVQGVKHGPTSQIIPSLKAIVTNISFHVDQFNNNKTHITLKDKEFGTSLRVLINDAHVTSSGLMEGSIISLIHFKTYRSPNYTTNCLVSTKHSRIIKNAKSKNLDDVRDLLPLVGCYQVEGKLEEIDKSFKTYQACPGSQCYETKVRELSSGYMASPKILYLEEGQRTSMGVW